MSNKKLKVSNVPNLRFSGFEGEWDSRKLGEVATLGRGKSKHRPRDAEHLFGDKYPFIQTGDIRKADLYLTEFTQSYSEAGLQQSKLWNENTLCITIAANIAETAILKIKACFPDSVIGLIPKDGKTIVLFVKYLFDKSKIEIKKLSQGVAQNNLNQEKLSKIEFFFPSLSEQQKISLFLSLIDERIQTQNKIIEELKLLKNTLSKKVFTEQLKFSNNSGSEFSEWKIEKLGNLSTITTGTSNREDSILDGEYTFFDRSQDIRASNKYLFDKEAIIVPGEGQEFIPKYYKGKFDLHQRTYAIFDFDNITGKYLYYHILSDDKYLRSQAVGSTVKSLRLPMFQSMPIKLPCIEEQTKIANFLSALDTKIDIEAQLLQKLEAQKKYLLSNLFI